MGGVKHSFLGSALKRHRPFRRGRLKLGLVFSKKTSLSVPCLRKRPLTRSPRVKGGKMKSSWGNGQKMSIRVQNGDSNGVFRFADTQFDAQQGRKSQRFPYKTIIFGPFSYLNEIYIVIFGITRKRRIELYFFIFLNPFPDWHFFSVSSRTPRFSPPWLVDSVLTS